jgi:hypothetical protein
MTSINIMGKLIKDMTEAERATTRAKQRERHHRYREQNLERQRDYYQRNRKRLQASQTAHRLARLEHEILRRAKARAKKRGIEFAITVSDIVIPSHCPVLGIALETGIGLGGGPQEHSPAIDRMDNTVGYVPGNVRVISYRANRLKNDASFEESRLIWEDAQRLGLIRDS